MDAGDRTICYLDCLDHFKRAAGPHACLLLLYSPQARRIVLIELLQIDKFQSTSNNIQTKWALQNKTLKNFLPVQNFNSIQYWLPHCVGKISFIYI